MLNLKLFPTAGRRANSLGWGHRHCKMAGCTVPIILRQMRIEGPGRCDSNSDERNDCYMMFIGEAYVHGKREGEAVKVFEGKAWGTESETFNVE